ncbi:hypothetical protein C8Q80DRAFT_1115130 [Daedaleopsis nitida]|nr:hypothetical protein C8Q80DRAFT_1115130 [Daedaleopsis nitida]
MLATPLIIFSLASTALSLSVPHYARARGPFYAREDSPPDQDLFDSCPGGPGSDKLERADKCTLINIVNNANVRKFAVLGDPQLNCGGATEDITVQLGGEQTVSQTTTVSANVGFTLPEGLSIGGGVETSDSTSTTISKTISFAVPPGKQAVFVAGTAHQSQTGNVQVNYADRQFGHFIWFTGSTITKLTPVANDVEFDVHQSDCGTDPRDLSAYNK